MLNREEPSDRAALSFTGGKDCHLAWYRVKRDRQLGLNVVALVVFHPPHPVFRAHPIQWMRVQADAVGLPLLEYCVDAETHDGNYRKAYAAAIQQLKTDHSISHIVTGDIDLVGTMPRNFMTEVCEELVPDMAVVLPLWQEPRHSLLREMLDVGLEIRFTCVKSPHFDATWIGRRLDRATFSELNNKQGLDVTGEHGEYHTMVLGGPMYLKRLVLEDVVGEELENQRGQTVRWWVCSKETELREEA